MLNYDAETHTLSLSATDVATALNISEYEAQDLLRVVAMKDRNSTLTVLAALARIRDTRQKARLALASVGGRDLQWDQAYLANAALVECALPYTIHTEIKHTKLWVNLLNDKGAVLWTGSTADSSFVTRFANVISL